MKEYEIKPTLVHLTTELQVLFPLYPPYPWHSENVCNLVKTKRPGVQRR